MNMLLPVGRPNPGNFRSIWVAGDLWRNLKCVAFAHMSGALRPTRHKISDREPRVATDAVKGWMANTHNASRRLGSRFAASHGLGDWLDNG
jgi:hypothetical protein